MSIICFWNRIGSFRILKEIKVSPPCFFNLTSNIMQMGLICIGHWRFLRFLGNCRLNFLEYFLISHAMQMPSSLIIDSDVLVWCTSKVLKYIFVLEKLSLKRSAEGQKYQTKISSVRHSFFIYLENIASFKTQKSLSCEKNNWEQLSPCLWQRKIWSYTFTPKVTCCVSFILNVNIVHWINTRKKAVLNLLFDFLHLHTQNCWYFWPYYWNR